MTYLLKITFISGTSRAVAFNHLPPLGQRSRAGGKRKTKTKRRSHGYDSDYSGNCTSDTDASISSRSSMDRMSKSACIDMMEQHSSDYTDED